VTNTYRIFPGEPYAAFFDQAYVRFQTSDTNSSPYEPVNIVSIKSDTKPNTSDGLPERLDVRLFRHQRSGRRPKRGPNDDYDGDGFTNLQEFFMGTDPTNANSCLRVVCVGTNFVSFLCQPYDLFELETTTNFTNWVRFGNPVQPPATSNDFPDLIYTNIIGMFTNLSITNPTKQFFRVRRVP